MLTMRCSMGSRTHISREGWIEEWMGDVTEDTQGGSVGVVTAEDIAGWRALMGAVLGDA